MDKSGDVGRKSWVKILTKVSFIVILKYTSYFFVILFLFVNVMHLCPWAVFVTVLAVGFMACSSAFFAFSVGDIIFTWSFSIFAHAVSPP